MYFATCFEKKSIYICYKVPEAPKIFGFVLKIRAKLRIVDKSMLKYHWHGVFIRRLCQVYVCSESHYYLQYRYITVWWTSEVNTKYDSCCVSWVSCWVSPFRILHKALPTSSAKSERLDTELTPLQESP